MHTRGKLFQHLARAHSACTAAIGAQSAAGTAPWRAIASSARSVTTPTHGTTAAAAVVGGFRGASRAMGWFLCDAFARVDGARGGRARC
jgi:hypothetical protein